MSAGSRLHCGNEADNEGGITAKARPLRTGFLFWENARGVG
jgi:hypothetical protein